ncbi:MAG: hypothetical protein ABJA66_00040 [Actinomycetota bacterium]
MINSKEKMISTDRLAHKFKKLWRGEHPRSFRAPGQVNLTGALIITTDSLLPMALNYQTTVAENRYQERAHQRDGGREKSKRQNKLTSK